MNNMSDVSQLPSKIKHEPIVEAVLELQFECGELEEVVVGRLADIGVWGDYSRNRLPQANIPGVIRQSDSSLRFSPVLELVSPDRSRAVRIGGMVVSFHVYSPYMGWPSFSQILHKTIDEVFSRVPSLRIARLGLRYVNFLIADLNEVRKAEDLSISIQVAGQPVRGSYNLNFMSSKSPSHVMMTRVATHEYVDLSVRPKGLVAAVDIDVSTPPGHSVTDAEKLKQWLTEAHDYEKQGFFALFPQSAIDKMKL